MAASGRGYVLGASYSFRLPVTVLVCIVVVEMNSSNCAAICEEVGLRLSFSRVDSPLAC